MRVALVAGSTRKLGNAIARRLAADGVGIVCHGADLSDAQVEAEGIRASGGHAVAVACDLTDADAVREMVADASRALGPIDILVNNALAATEGPIEDIGVEDFRGALRDILDTAFHCSQAVLPAMQSRGWGRIVNLSGLAGQTGARSQIGIVTGNSGILGFTKSLALEFAASGVTCNAVAPGPLATDDDPARREQAGRNTPQIVDAHTTPRGRLATPDDIAAAIAYLCSEEAGFVTGQTLGVNGGLYV